MPAKKSLLSYKIGDKELYFHRPLVMGILNVTPDSFYDGGQYTSKPTLEKRITQLIEEGADIIDIGAISSRPGSVEVSEREELKRLIPPLTYIRKNFPQTIVSIDTFRASVVDYIVKCFGAVIVNDIYGGSYDKNMPAVIAKYNLPYVVMHMQGNPQTMQQNSYYKDVVGVIHTFLENRIAHFLQKGAKQLFLDPGFGFGKTIAHNYTLLAKLKRFGSFGYPILAGISRKSMICKPLGIRPLDALNGTSALHMIALLNGASVLRVHDIKAAKQVVGLFTTYKKSE